jgi:UDP-N-acetylmuramoyl-tripeptide--D-alanyl-D-alanine ligase
VNLELTWSELARATGGRLIQGEPGAGVGPISTDSRRVEPGQVFWALKGPNFDAHDFLDAELAKRCAGWVVGEGSISRLKSLPPSVVETSNTLRGLQSLAAYHRKRFEIPVVGITGSNGKTTTKEMLGAICRKVGSTCLNPGNFNNEVGLPLALLELTPSHRYGIFEMGASHPGDISLLARLAQPTLAILTNIGPAHLEFFGTLEGTFKTKSELLDHLSEDGKAVINIDDPWLAGLEPRLGSRAVTYGMTPRARVHFDDEGCLVIDRHRVPVKLKGFGRLSRYNAAAAAAAAWALGIDAGTIREGLESFQPAAMRLERRTHASGCEFILDAYNANPASMRASIEAVCEEFKDSRKVLVLGDMKELGPESGQMHYELGTLMAGLPLAAVYLAGADMDHARRALAEAKAPFPCRYGKTSDEWVGELKKELSAKTTVLFKASRAMAFEKLVARL